MRAFILLYVLMYASFGVASPFWPRFFETRGMSPEQIGVLLGLGTVVRLIAGPVAGRMADRWQRLRQVLAASAALAACLAFGLPWIGGFWIFLIVHLCHGAALTPTTSLADALALDASKSRAPGKAFDYGWVRGSASAAFVFGTLAAGQVIGWATLTSIAWMHGALLLLAAASTILLPTPHNHVKAASEPSSARAIGQLIGIVAFRRMVLIAALVYGSHAMHDAFAVIRWNAAGVSSTTISLLWSEAVIAEVVVFVLIGPRWVDALGPSGAAAIACAAAVLRWLVVGSSTHPAALAIVQPLHGLTFALLHLACMRLIGTAVPRHLAATGQAIYALGPALLTALLTLSSGVLYARLGAGAFLLMALLPALALPLCSRLKTPPPLRSEE
ncbi:MFS transporter [Variovorax soli]|uniref:PPP family 3-phenylpropionic acid transporter n=1 Tax=Variovorax soli TaxID=376815 RepID=A0ABU1NKW4_9BURK|nr:MFS transporter [Variovorax soli]MDR6539099.1 PPP family 3-phenylpropionic acid transporter [Variovorax soli]